MDRTTLDGSKSTDDQKIASYHWTQIKSVRPTGGHSRAPCYVDHIKVKTVLLLQRSGGGED